MEKRVAEVAVPVPAAKCYCYEIPSELEGELEVGSAVLVNFHGRRLVGWVIGFRHAEIRGVKPISKLIESKPMFTPGMLKFFQWISEYYLSPLGLVINHALPVGVVPKERENCVLVSEPETGNEFSRRIVAYLNNRGRETSVRSIEKKFGKDSLKVLRRLSASGHVRMERELIPPKVRVKFGRWVSFLCEPEEATAKQRSVLRFLKERGDAPIADVQGALGVDSSVIRRLEKKGAIRSYLKEEFRDSLDGLFLQEEPPRSLTSEQTRTLDHIVDGLKGGTFEVVLVHGVTGSGKTEIYLRAIEKALELGRGAIFLVPEIFLTTQFTSSLFNRFGPVVTEYHSALGAGEQYDAWRRVRDGEAKVVIGPRSALFVPMANLGLVIVDEEHERTFKQSDLTPRYNARDAAIVRARHENALCVLGSATPSLESYHNARKGKYTLFDLPERIGSSKLPSVTLVDMRKERRVLSELLKAKIQERFEKNEQTILFINRRGYSNYLQCVDCGATIRCPDCSVTLTYHRVSRVLKCHYCGFERRPPEACEGCHGTHLRYMGFGTQRVEEELHRNLPDLRVLRVDLDTTALKGSHLVYFRKFKQREVDLLLGTQMVAKGFDFPFVTLVGVISADTGLNIPDFRSSERTFQLLTQVAGRAGRGAREGEVVIQTFCPSHYAVEFSRTHAYTDFFSHEIVEREALDYPPFARLASITLRSKHAEEAERLALEISRRLKSSNISILGPAPCVLSRIRGYHRYRMILKSKKDMLIQRVIREILPEYANGSDGRVSIDMDPIDLL